MNEETIFAAARELKDGSERQAYLEQVCGGNPTLRQQVEQLLKADLRAASALEKPPGFGGATQPQVTVGGKSNWDELDNEDLSFLSPSAAPDHLGRLGTYEVLELIGRGGMGVVLRGQDPKLNRVVAIKALVPELAANAMARKRFLREAQAAAAVSHDHVVTIHAVEAEARVPYLVMECVIGQSLQQKIDRVGALQVKEILRIGMQIAMGLAAAHKQGLIHRDIKPANILLENGVERVKISDFGLARTIDDVGITQSGVIAGTPQYMSPEQAMGEPLDQRSDLFSLGSVLYTMCTGRPAFRADSTIAVIRRVCEDLPRPIAELNPDVPDFLIDIIDRLLAKNPNERYQTAAEVATLLEQHLAQIQQQGMSSGHRTVAGSSKKTATKPPSPESRSELVWSIVGVVSLIILVTMVIPSMWRRNLQSTFATNGTTASQDSPADAVIKSLPGTTVTSDMPKRATAPFDANHALEVQTGWAKHVNVPVDYTNSIGMKLRLIPPGEFWMGSTPAELADLARDLEQVGASAFDKFVASSSVHRHLVRITEPFYMGQYEVTAAQYLQFVEATKYEPEKNDRAHYKWRDFIVEGQADKLPVMGLSWNDAQAFCRWLSEQEKLKYDLPTEAQWEYACRAGTETLWSSGDDVSTLETQAVYGLNTSQPSPIGLKQANNFGLYDMHGNANEWCLDWHVFDYYSRSMVSDPVCLNAPGDPGTGRVSRGGSWNATAWWSRSATRTYDFPGNPVHPKGFRVTIRGNLKAAAAPAKPAAMSDAAAQ